MLTLMENADTFFFKIMFAINPSCHAPVQVAEKTDLARIVTKAKVFKLVTEGNACVGCVYEKGGQNFQEFGPVILASGGVVFGHILWPFQNFKFRDFKIFSSVFVWLVFCRWFWCRLHQQLVVGTV